MAHKTFDIKEGFGSGRGKSEHIWRANFSASRLAFFCKSFVSLRKNRKTFFYAYFIMKFPKVCRDETNVEPKRDRDRGRERERLGRSAAEKAFCEITLKTKMHYCHLKCKHALSCHRSFESLLFVLLALLSPLLF